MATSPTNPLTIYRKVSPVRSLPVPTNLAPSLHLPRQERAPSRQVPISKEQLDALRVVIPMVSPPILDQEIRTLVTVEKTLVNLRNESIPTSPNEPVGKLPINFEVDQIRFQECQSVLLILERYKATDEKQLQKLTQEKKWLKGFSLFLFGSLSSIPLGLIAVGLALSSFVVLAAGAFALGAWCISLLGEKPFSDKLFGNQERRLQNIIASYKKRIEELRQTITKISTFSVGIHPESQDAMYPEAPPEPSQTAVETQLSDFPARFLALEQRYKTLIAQSVTHLQNAFEKPIKESITKIEGDITKWELVKNILLYPLITFSVGLTLGPAIILGTLNIGLLSISLLAAGGLMAFFNVVMGKINKMKAQVEAKSIYLALREDEAKTHQQKLQDTYFAERAKLWVEQSTVAEQQQRQVLVKKGLSFITKATVVRMKNGLFYQELQNLFFDTKSEYLVFKSEVTEATINGLFGISQELKELLIFTWKLQNSIH